MRCAVLAAHGKPLQIRQLPIPQPGPSEILVKLEASGVCHTDVHIWRGDLRASSDPVPFVLGHEGIGVVVAVGEGVTTWQPGARAGIPWLHSTCGICNECTGGHESFCQTQRAHGLDVPGAFAEYVVADARFAVPLPQSINPLSSAPLMCAGVTAYGAIRRARLTAGETVVIFGCGGLGLYAVQIAARLGARVIAVDRDEAKLQLAKQYGAAETLRADDQLVSHFDATHRAEACINFAPTPATWSGMVAAVKPRGRIVAAAMVSEPVELNQSWLTSTGVTITGTSVGTRGEMEEIIAAHGAQPLKSETISIGLDQVTEALESLERGTANGRFIIDFR